MINQYLVNSIMSSTPHELLIKVYDVIIVSCQSKNFQKANEAIRLLRTSLVWEPKEVGEISRGLNSLYEYCEEETRKGNYDVVLKIMIELRDTWKSIKF